MAPLSQAGSVCLRLASNQTFKNTQIYKWMGRDGWMDGSLNHLTTRALLTGDLLLAKPCLLRDGSAEQGGVVAIEGLEGGVVGREVTRTWFPARNKSQELQQFRLYFTGSSGILLRSVIKLFKLGRLAQWRKDKQM